MGRALRNRMPAHRTGLSCLLLGCLLLTSCHSERAAQSFAARTPRATAPTPPPLVRKAAPSANTAAQSPLVPPPVAVPTPHSPQSVAQTAPQPKSQSAPEPASQPNSQPASQPNSQPTPQAAAGAPGD